MTAAAGQPDPPPPIPPSAGWFRRLTYHALLAGLCPLIPVPWLDDRALRTVRRRMVRERFERLDLDPTAEQVRLLADDPPSSLGETCWALGCVLPVVKMTVYLLRKLVRKIVVVLTLKEASDRFSELFHHGYLLHRGLQQARREGLLDQAALDAESGLDAPNLLVRRLRRTIDDSIDRIDPRPVNRVARRLFRGSGRLLRRAARLLGRLVRSSSRDALERSGDRPRAAADELDRQETALLGGLLDSLTGALWHEGDYRGHLDRTFDRSWQALAPAEPPVPETESR